jgi:hypothetical protein
MRHRHQRRRLQHMRMHTLNPICFWLADAGPIGSADLMDGLGTCGRDGGWRRRILSIFYQTGVCGDHTELQDFCEL